MKKNIILASQSPWRKRLLKKHGIKCVVRVSNYEEKRKHESPRKLVLHNACGKALSVAEQYSDALVIGVDTIVVLDGKIIGKPTSKESAKRMIRKLSARTHKVFSGLCVVDSKTGMKYTDVCVTKVAFRHIDKKELEKYLDSGQWEGKAGSYAIQGIAKKFIKKIDGDITNVIGISIESVRKLLRTC